MISHRRWALHTGRELAITVGPGGTMLYALLACGVLELDPATPTAWVVYDPTAGDLPVPNDLARDADLGGSRCRSRRTSPPPSRPSALP